VKGKPSSKYKDATWPSSCLRDFEHKGSEKRTEKAKERGLGRGIYTMDRRHPRHA